MREFTFLHHDHRTELEQGSSIAPDLAAANCESVSGENLFNILYPPVRGKNGYGDKRYLNRGILSSEYQRHFERCQNSSGWAFYAVSPVTGERSGYTRVKLDPDSELGECWEQNDQGQWVKLNKRAKYKSAKGSGVQIPFPAVPESIWSKCSQTTQHGINGETHFWEWLKDGGDIPLAIVEGEKKGLSVLSLGFPAIPTSGITMWSARDEKNNRILHPDLELFAVKGRPITLIFDSDVNCKTRFNTEQEKTRLAYELIKRGCKVKIAEIPLLDGKKGAIDDYIASGGNGLQLIGNAIDFDIYQAKKLKQLTRKPDIILNQRFLDVDIPVDRRLVCVKSPKGTGKTELMARYLKPATDAGSIVSLLPTHRKKLGEQTADRIGIKYVEEATIQDQKERGMSLCFDSFVEGGKGQIHPEDWGKAVMFVDEADQSSNHVLLSSTCENRRVQILEMNEKVVKTVKQVVLASADLDDKTIQYYEEMMGEKAFIIENQYQDESFNFNVINFPHSKPNIWFDELIEFISKGLKAFVGLSAQGEDSKFSSTALENFLKAKFPHLRILRMDSVTTSDSLHPASQAIKNPEILKQYDVVLATPVIETGVNINFSHFDGVWGMTQGLISSNSFRQVICRVRPPVPRYIWSSNKALTISKIGSGATSPKALIESENHKDKAIRALLLNAKVIENDEDFGIEVNDIHFKMWAKIAALINAEIPIYRKAILEGLKDEGHRIYSYEEWKKSQVLCELESDVEVDNGEEFTSAPPPITQQEIIDNLPKIEEKVQSFAPIDQQLFWSALAHKNQEIEERVEVQKKELKSNRNEVRLRASGEILKAEYLSDSDYEKKRIQDRKTEEEYNQIRGKIVDKKYGVERSLELIERDWNRRYHPQLKLHYNYTIGREFINEKQKYKLDMILEQGEGKRFIPDSNRCLLISIKLHWLDFLQLNDLLEAEEISAVHPLVLKIHDNAKKYEGEIKLGLGLAIGKSPMQFVQNIVKLIGFKFPCLGQKLIGDKRIRIYGKAAFDFEKDDRGKIKIINDRAVAIGDDREKIFEAWLNKDIERRAEKLGLASAEQVEFEKLKSEMGNAIAVQPTEKVLLDEDDRYAHDIGSVLVSSYEKLRTGCLNLEGFKSVVIDMIHDFRLQGGILQKLARNIFQRSTALFSHIKAITPDLDQALMA